MSIADLIQAASFIANRFIVHRISKQFKIMNVEF